MPQVVIACLFDNADIACQLTYTDTVLRYIKNIFFANPQFH